MSTTKEDVRSRGRQIRAQTCIHWRGVFAKPPCALGVDLVALAGPRVQPDWGYRVPCCGTERAVFVCERRELRSEEQIEAEHQSMLAALDTAVVVMQSIGIDKKVTSGEVPCPKCSGTIDWSRSPTNGHLRVACRTPECFRMME